MRTIAKKAGSKKAFSIIELLTIMGIIVLLVSLLVPALSQVQRYAKKVKQQAQFHAISVALDLFYSEYEEYPESGALDPNTDEYCGAMKLCEAMVGQDMLGFHPQSAFYKNNKQLYPDLDLSIPAHELNVKSRKQYLQAENANAYSMKDIYPDTHYTNSNFTVADADVLVLCDIYTMVQNLSGEGESSIGMPILYYRANTSNLLNDPNKLTESIYNYQDNEELLAMGMPWQDTMVEHRMYQPAPALAEVFYEEMLWNRQIKAMPRPYRPDSYILISAGFDGEYGTSDDVTNFGN